MDTFPDKLKTCYIYNSAILKTIKPLIKNKGLLILISIEPIREISKSRRVGINQLLFII